MVLTEVDGATRVTIRLGFGAAVHALVPSRISVRAPSLVTELMEAPLLAYAGALELKSHSIVVQAGAADAFIEEQLKADGRALPVLVASSEVDRSLVDGLTRGLAGIAQVVRALDRVADLELRDMLRPSGYTVPRAGLRLFWPGYGSERQPPRNPYWTAAQLRIGRAPKGRSVLDQLVNLLGPISTARVPVDPGLLRARQESLSERAEAQKRREEAKRQRARRQREAARQAKQEAQSSANDDRVLHLEERLAEVEAQFSQAESERKEAEEQVVATEAAELAAVEEAMQFSERAEQLQAENEALRRNLQTIQRFESGDERGDGEEDPVPEEIENWEEIEEHLSDLEGPGFCLTDLAKSCADKNRYPHPPAMWKSLRALERIGRAYNELGADLGMRFEQFALDREGLDVALQDNSYVGHLFEYEGSTYSRLPHVKIDDAKAPNEVGRIYFALDKEGKRVIVDWFGTKPDRPESKSGLSAAA